MNKVKRWHIIYTKRSAEKKVCHQLHKKNIEHFYSTCTWLKNQHISRPLVRPLFERKIFVLINDTDFAVIKELEGVLHFMHLHNRPAEINSTEIEILRRFTARHKNIRLEKIVVNTTTSSATVFINNDNNINAGHKNCIKAILPSIGVSLVADIEKQHVDELSVVHTRYTFKENFTGSIG